MLQALKKESKNKRKAESKTTHHLPQERIVLQKKPDILKSIKHYKELV
jgi:hypothetical protein